MPSQFSHSLPRTFLEAARLGDGERFVNPMDCHSSESPACEPASAGSTGRLFKIAVLTVFALACAIPFAMNVVDPDLWGHVRYGQDWMAQGKLPRTATHTFTAEGYPWVNHENAFEYAVAWGCDRLGIYGVLLLKCLLGMAVVATMAAVAARHGVPALSAWALLVLIAANLQAFFPLRPQLFSFALCAVMLVCLDRAFVAWFELRTIRWSWLLPLPPLMAAWVNSHGGFVAGLCILGAYLAGRMIELWWSHGRWGWKSQLGIAGIGLASLAATAINPYGVELHRWIAASMWTPQPEITEWLAPSIDNPVFLPFATLCLTTLICLRMTDRRRDWTKVVILALVGWQAWSHLRHIAFFALLAGFWLPEHWHATLLRMRPDKPLRWNPSPSQQVKNRPWLFASAAALLAAIAMESTTLSERLSNFPVYRSTYPVDALQYMVDHKLQGKLVVAFNWAQYALTALAPEVTVGFDGRFDTCYPDEVIDAHFDFLLGDYGFPRFRNPQSGPFDAKKVLRLGSPDLVLIDRHYPGPLAVMLAESKQEQPAWTLLYSDSLAELWGRADRYDNPHSDHFLPVAERTLNVRLLQARFQWPALPDRSLLEEWDAEDEANDLAASTPTAQSPGALP